MIFSGVAALARRRRFCQNCGAVQIAEEGEACLECGRFALTTNGEPWRRIRDRRADREEIIDGTTRAF